MSQRLPEIPSDKFSTIKEDIVKYKIQMSSCVEKTEPFGSKILRRHMIFLSPNYPNYLFYHTNDLTVRETGRPNDFIGNVTNRSYYYRNLDSGLKGEVEYIMKNIGSIDYRNLNFLFNSGTPENRLLPIRPLY